MALKKTWLALMLLLIIVFSFIGLIQLEKNNPPKLTFSAFPNHTPLMFLSQPVFTDTVKSEPQPLIANLTRMKIYNLIVENPGIQFRGICNAVGIAIGTAEFHLGVLKKAGLITFIRDGKYKRFFASKEYSFREMKLISFLRHNTLKEIVKEIMCEKTVSHSKLASCLFMTSQGLTWQMNRLKAEGLVQITVSGIKVTYSLNEAYVQALPELLCMVEQFKS